MYSPYLTSEEVRSLELMSRMHEYAVEAESFSAPAQALRTNRFVPTVANKAEDISPLSVGSHIPQITLHNRFGETVNVQESLQEKPAVLVFYRGGWCPYCNYQLSNMLLVEEYLDRLGYNIFGISPESEQNLSADTTPHFMKFQLLSDSAMDVSKQFGLAFSLDKTTHNEWKSQYGVDIQKHSGQSHLQLPVPAVFIIDRTGVIRYRFFNPDYTIRLRTERLLMMAEVFAHV